MTDGFKADPKIQWIAEACALDAVDIAREAFDMALDWSDASIEEVEMTLGELRERITDAGSSEEKIFGFEKYPGVMSVRFSAATRHAFAGDGNYG